MSGHLVRVIGRSQRDVGEVAQMPYIFKRSFVVSDAKFESAFGIEVTPHDIALEQTLDWYQKTKATWARRANGLSSAGCG
jgi:hypothetical protein